MLMHIDFRNRMEKLIVQEKLQFCFPFFLFCYNSVITHQRNGHTITNSKKDYTKGTHRIIEENREQNTLDKKVNEILRLIFYWTHQ